LDKCLTSNGAKRVALVHTDNCPERVAHGLAFDGAERVAHGLAFDAARVAFVCTNIRPARVAHGLAFDGAERLAFVRTDIRHTARRSVVLGTELFLGPSLSVSEKTLVLNREN
jgi:hypothetical protein